MILSDPRLNVKARRRGFSVFIILFALLALCLVRNTYTNFYTTFLSVTQFQLIGTMGRHSTAITTAIVTPAFSPSRKRKREDNSAEEIEVDVTAPEPPSKKALRKAKKGKTTSATHKSESKSIVVKTGPVSDEDAPTGSTEPPKRSEYGIWIGNLPWTATKADLRNFLTKDTELSDKMITRLHLPAPSQGEVANSRQRIKPQNKGFAYIDFSSEEALTEALALSEKLLTGRRVLIKDSKSFEGRPERTKEQETAQTAGNHLASAFLWGIWPLRLQSRILKNSLQDVEKC